MDGQYFFLISGTGKFTFPSGRPLLLLWRASSWPSMVNASSDCQKSDRNFKKKRKSVCVLDSCRIQTLKQGSKEEDVSFTWILNSLWAMPSLSVPALLRKSSPPFLNHWRQQFNFFSYRKKFQLLQSWVILNQCQVLRFFLIHQRDNWKKWKFPSCDLTKSWSCLRAARANFVILLLTFKSFLETT